MKGGRGCQTGLAVVVACFVLAVSVARAEQFEYCGTNVVYGYENDHGVGSGNAQVGTVHLNIEQPDECHKLCVADPECFNFLWNRVTKECILKTAEIVAQALRQSTMPGATIDARFCNVNMVYRCTQVNCLQCPNSVCAYHSDNVISGSRACPTGSYIHNMCNPHGILTKPSTTTTTTTTKISTTTTKATAAPTTTSTTTTKATAAPTTTSTTTTKTTAPTTTTTATTTTTTVPSTTKTTTKTTIPSTTKTTSTTTPTTTTRTGSPTKPNRPGTGSTTSSTTTTSTSTSEGPEVPPPEVEPEADEGGVGGGVIAGATAGGLAAVGAGAYAVHHFASAASTVVSPPQIGETANHQMDLRDNEASVTVDESNWV